MKLALAALLVTACGGGHPPLPYVYGLSPTPQPAIRPLDGAQQALIDKQGFAILGGSESPSFHLGYTALFEQHQPVYVTADSLLYAWHSSYDALLLSVEYAHLIPTLQAMLGDLRARLAASKADPETRGDVDVYLAVALSFLEDKVAPPVAGGDAALIAEAVRSGKAELPALLKMFGGERELDFSMFRPRGHYELEPELQRYFRAMSWLGRAEVVIASRLDAKAEWKVDRRALRGARLLASLFEGSTRAQWNTIDRTLAAFVGPQDSMSMDGLIVAMATLGNNPDAPDERVIAALEGASKQQIRSRLIKAGGEALSFLVMGQRFVADSKVLSDLVYGSLSVKRLMPSPLDVAHATFGNPAAKPLLASELERFGPTYGQALEAAARAKRDPALWEGTLYHGWLEALAKLSPDPKADAGLPAPLTSDAWARRMLNTQLASWAELRHDNLLYAKQSYTAEVECEFPDAYVDPYPAFYAAMGRLAKRGKATLASLHNPKLERASTYFEQMATTMEQLERIAEQERANEPLRPAQLDFINRMVSLEGRFGGCGGPASAPAGWYADLFFDRGKILSFDPVIADIHTQPDDEAGNRVGRVLHVGTRDPRMFAVRIQHDGGKHAQTYRGFVSTYAETTSKDFKRYTDSEWKDAAIQGTPAWLAPLVTATPR